MDNQGEKATHPTYSMLGLLTVLLPDIPYVSFIGKRTHCGFLWGQREYPEIHRNALTEVFRTQDCPKVIAFKNNPRLPDLSCGSGNDVCGKCSVTTAVVCLSSTGPHWSHFWFFPSGALLWVDKYGIMWQNHSWNLEEEQVTPVEQNAWRSPVALHPWLSHLIQTVIISH